jgi:hypothetical protein
MKMARERRRTPPRRPISTGERVMKSKLLVLMLGLLVASFVGWLPKAGIAAEKK